MHPNNPFATNAYQRPSSARPFSVLLFRALSHPDRFQILIALANREMSVATMKNALSIQQPTLS
jgi:hypothetical protein